MKCSYCNIILLTSLLTRELLTSSQVYVKQIHGHLCPSNSPHFVFGLWEEIHRHGENMQIITSKKALSVCTKYTDSGKLFQKLLVAGRGHKTS